MESALHQLWVCFWGSEKCAERLLRNTSSPLFLRRGWTITALNAVRHPAWTDVSTGLLVRLSEESGTGGCHGDAGRWREQVAYSGWHDTSCSVLSGSLSRVICVSVRSVQPTELHWSGCRGLTLQGCFRLGRGGWGWVLHFVDRCVCWSASKMERN